MCPFPGGGGGSRENSVSTGRAHLYEFQRCTEPSNMYGESFFKNWRDDKPKLQRTFLPPPPPGKESCDLGWGAARDLGGSASASVRVLTPPCAALPAVPQDPVCPITPPSSPSPFTPAPHAGWGPSLCRLARPEWA